MTESKATTLPVTAFDLVQVTERSAMAAARFRGCGDEHFADQAASAAMYAAVDQLAITGHVVIGEMNPPEGFDADCLGHGGDEVDLALAPLEGSTLCAKDMPNAITTMAVAKKGSLLKVPSIYMEKMAIGGVFDQEVIDLAASPAENIARFARASGKATENITVCILDRSRHAGLIAQVRETGAAVRLISDGDIASVIATANAAETGIDIYMGVGGAPEAVLAAAALRCLGGQMQARLVIRNNDDRVFAKAANVKDVNRIYSLDDLVGGDVLFAASGITRGSMLGGVVFQNGHTTTESLVMCSASGTVRRVRSRHANNRHPS